LATTVTNIVAGFAAGAAAGLILHFLSKNSYIFENLFDGFDGEKEHHGHNHKEEHHHAKNSERHAKHYHKTGHPVKPKNHTRKGEAEFYPSNNEFARFEHKSTDVMRPDNLAI
jgi:hypothetical protein